MQAFCILASFWKEDKQSVDLKNGVQFLAASRGGAKSPETVWLRNCRKTLVVSVERGVFHSIRTALLLRFISSEIPHDIPSREHPPLGSQLGELEAVYP